MRYVTLALLLTACAQPVPATQPCKDSLPGVGKPCPAVRVIA